MRLVKFYIKCIIFKILSINLNLQKIYHFYKKFTSYRRFRSKNYALSSINIIEKNITPIINKLLETNKRIDILDIGCGPDIFNNVYLYKLFNNKIKQDLIDCFKELNKTIVKKSFNFIFIKDDKDHYEDFFQLNQYQNIDLTNTELRKKYDLIIGIYLIDSLSDNQLNFLLENIKNKAKFYIFASDLTDQYFIDHWDKKYDYYRFNKLKYSEKFFNLLNNRIYYQNRLRMNDYEKLFLDHGFEILESIRCDEIHKKINDNYFNNKKYLNFKVDKKFQNYSYENLYTPKGIFLLKNKN